MQHRRLRLRSASQGSAPAPAAQHHSTATRENQEHLTRVRTGNSVSPLDKTYHGGRLGHRLSLLDLDTGAAFALGADLQDGRWSPDGRWIAATSTAHRIVLIDATNTSRRRNLGSSGDASIRWSPDSKYLLLLKSELRCTLSLFFDSLQTLEVKTGRRIVIKSSRCEVTAGTVGWIGCETAR